MPKRKIERKHHIYRTVFKNPVDGVVREKYRIGEVEVYIVDRDGYGYYLVNEPKYDDDFLDLYNMIMDKLIYMIKPVKTEENPEEERRRLREIILKTSEELRLDVEKNLDKLLYYIYRDMHGYERIDVLMHDDDIEEISCTSFNKPVHVIHRRYSEYDWLATNIFFNTNDDLNSFAYRLAQMNGGSVSTAYPVADIISREGSRISITYRGQITLPGSTFSIRKFPKEPLTITRILSYNTLSPLMAAYLWLLLEVKGYIMVIGAMGSGKTTLLSCLTNLINPNWKICTVEDTPEVLTFHEQWLRMKTRKPLFKSEMKPIDLTDLVLISLRHRPDYIIVGETRGVEIQALTQAAGLGHGCLTTFHAVDPRNALTRMSAPPLNVGLSGELLIWAFATTRRISYKGGAIRRIVSIDEVDPNSKNDVRIVNIFRWSINDDIFEPDSSEDVAKRSVRVKHVMDYTGFSMDDIVGELDKRSKFLKSLVDRKIFRYSDVVREFKKYYYTGYDEG